jgi:hypothetical protein
MGWSWDQFEDCPAWVVEALLAQLNRDHEERENKAQAAELKRRHDAGRL